MPVYQFMYRLVVKAVVRSLIGSMYVFKGVRSSDMLFSKRKNNEHINPVTPCTDTNIKAIDSASYNAVSEGSRTVKSGGYEVATIKDRMEFAWNVAGKNLELIKFADAKAAVLLTGLTTFTLLSANAMFSNTSLIYHYMRIPLFITLTAGIGSFLFAAHYCLLTIKPRGHKFLVQKKNGKCSMNASKCGYVYHADIVRIADEAEGCNMFIDEFSKLDHLTLLEELLLDSWRVAHVANEKYESLNVAFNLTYCSACFTAISWLLFIVGRGIG